MPPSTLLFVVIVDGLFTDPPNMSANIPENIGAPDRMKLGTLMPLFVRYNFQSAEMGQPCHGMGLAFPAIFLRCAHAHAPTSPIRRERMRLRHRQEARALDKEGEPRRQRPMGSAVGALQPLAPSRRRQAPAGRAARSRGTCRTPRRSD